MLLETRFETNVVASTLIEPLLRRVKSEYLEMPGLSLTAAQAARLFGVNAETCVVLLPELETTGFLRRTARGQYVRADSY